MTKLQIRVQNGILIKHYSLRKDNRRMNENNDLIVSWKRANEIITSVYIVAILVIFPLAFYNYYFDILDVKYMFYYGSVILLTVVILITAFVYMYIDARDYQWENTRCIFKHFRRRPLRIADWAMIFFMAAVSVSTLQSDYFYESFWGNEGRYTGMFLILLYFVSFFIVTRFLKFKRWYLDIFLAAGMVVCLIGILQFFEIDPIGFKVGLSWDDYRIFASTIGNINTYTSYIALVSGMSVVLFAQENNVYRKVWYTICVIISLFALITGISANAYLALIALFGLLPIYLFDSIKGIKKYMFLLALLFSEFQLIDIIIGKFPEHVLEITGLFNVVVGYDKLLYVVAGLWALTIFIHILDINLIKENYLQKKGNLGRWIWFAVLISGILCIGYILFDVNINGNADRYGSLKNYLVLDDEWGTHRGYIWRIGIESYQKFPLIHKIFGHGPDTFGIITVNNYYDEMLSRYYEKFDSAHNEYLQYFITIGVVGLAAYLSLLFTAIKEMIRASSKKPLLVAISFSIICYGAQAVVNISVPIVAPIMLTLLMVGVVAAREVADKDKHV